MMRTTLDQVPNNIKRFRYENLFFSGNANSEDFDFYVKNVETDSHLHFFKHAQESGLVLTNENKRGTEEEHTTIAIEKFMIALSELVLEFWLGFERIENDDQRFRRHLVQLVTSPEIFLDKTRDGKAYFAHQLIGEEIIFEKIDPFLAKFGVILDDQGNEIELIFTRGGEIWHYDLDLLNELTDKFYRKYPDLSFVN